MAPGLGPNNFATATEKIFRALCAHTLYGVWAASWQGSICQYNIFIEHAKTAWNIQRGRWSLWSDSEFIVTWPGFTVCTGQASSDGWVEEDQMWLNCKDTHYCQAPMMNTYMRPPPRSFHTNGGYSQNGACRGLRGTFAHGSMLDVWLVAWGREKLAFGELLFAPFAWIRLGWYLQTISVFEELEKSSQRRS